MFRKKGFIYNWWIGTKTEKLRFVDIFAEDFNGESCIVVGQLHTPFHELETSRNPVVKVTKKGIITASGRFYSYKTAHPLYLMFLKALHEKEETCIAFNWREVGENQIEADLIFPDGVYGKDIVFDFTSIYDSPKRLCGFSKMMQSRVVLNMFDTKPINLQYKGWISTTEVYETAEEYSEKRKQIIREIKNIS